MFLGFVLVGFIGYVDYWTGNEIGFSLFYLIPIVVVTWFAGAVPGAVIASLSAATWMMADRLAGARYSSPFIPYWNTLIRYTFFLITVFALRQKKLLEQEKSFARTDAGTGAMNSRFFRAVAQREIDRSRRTRQPFTAIYMDIDNFKGINDTRGHLAGDQVLRTAASVMQRNLRKTDLVARIGGDEFAILLPDVGAITASVVVSKLHAKLADEMRQHGWPVTFSMGVVTFTALPESVDEILRVSDELMYRAKYGGKNTVCYSEYTERREWKDVAKLVPNN